MIHMVVLDKIFLYIHKKVVMNVNLATQLNHNLFSVNLD